MRPHRRRNMLYCDSDAPSNVANRPDGRPERSDTCDPSTAIFIHLRVALAGRCHDQLRPDLLETPEYGKRCSVGYVSACSTLIPALSSLKPSTYTHQLRVGDAANRAEAVMTGEMEPIGLMCSCGQGLIKPASGTILGLSET